MSNFYYKYALLFAGLIFSNFLFAQHLPINFIPNEGQWKEDFLYKGVSSFADIYLEKAGITFVVGDQENSSKMHGFKESIIPEDSMVSLKYHSYKMKWINANPEAKTIPSKEQSFYHNYYLGSDSSKWKSKVGVFRNVDYENIYSKIDLHISSSKGNAKYDFIVKPNANPEEIRFKYEGLDNVQLKNGQLILTTSVGEIIETAPYAFQYIDGNLEEVVCEYLLSADGEVYFNFPKGYDKSVNLIIDPVIVFASLTGSTADNWGFTATYDEDGNFYAGGIANGLGYPTSTGAFQITYGGGATGSMPCDMTISKFTSNGSNLMYSTYIGGDGDDMPHSLIVDENGNLLISGKTNSTNYPTTSGAFQAAHNGGYDILISKLNANGTAMLASTYVGGTADDGVHVSISYYADQNTLKYNYGDGSRSEIIIDEASNIYLAGNTHSANFPITTNAAKSTLGGVQDGIFVKFNPTLTNMIYGTYIGGSQDDAAYVIALDTAESKVYVGGGTSSSDFHNAAMSNGYQSAFQGGLSDGYILRFLNSGNYTLEAGTFIGTSNYDQCYGLEVDLENGVYVMGQSLGNFPVSSGVYSNPGSPQFLMKLNADLSSSIYSTVFGSGVSSKPNISPVAFLVDTCQNVYISGWASPGISPGSSTAGMPITNNAFQSTTDDADFYFIVLSKNATGLLFGSFFGSPGKSEHVDGGTSRFDPQGVVYQSICASCGAGSAYPSTPGAYATVKGSNNCNLGAVKIAFNLGSVKAEAEANPVASGCAPLTVNFENNSSNATSYEWHFGDGSPVSNSTSPTHVFQNTGIFNVMMIAINPDACKTRDTVYLEINVSDEVIEADFDFNLADICTNPNVTFENLSTPRPGSNLTSATYLWDFGDGNSYTGVTPPVHYYSGAGSYNVKLIMIDTAACNSPDTIMKTIDIIQEDVLASFNPESPICLGDSISLNNTSQNGMSYYWDFGNGESSTDENPAYHFNSVGAFTIKLIVRNPNSCNEIDSAVHVIEVFPNPVANFTFSPNPSELNSPVVFQNQSQNAQSYHWTFGDGKISEEENPIHNYTKTGDYTVCLTAFNEQGCKDEKCKTLRAEIESIADLPSGFSPNGDGENDILYVRGYNIEGIDLKIFNRWGQMVFQSVDVNKGWDGTYNGKPQEMEVYAFTLEVTFLDGKKEYKKGNVTLLR